MTTRLVAVRLHWAAEDEMKSEIITLKKTEQKWNK